MSVQMLSMETLSVYNVSERSDSSHSTTDWMSICDTGGDIEVPVARAAITSTSDCGVLAKSRDPASPERGFLQTPFTGELIKHVEIASTTSGDDTPSYHGFINLVTMEPANQISEEGVRVTADLLHLVKSLYESPLSELLKNLDTDCKKKDRGEVIKSLQVEVLPLLAKQKQLSEISECLMIEEAGLQRIACSFLEEILLSLRRSHDVSVTKELLDVAERSMKVLMKSTDDDDKVVTFTILHLMAVSAMFIRTQKPELEKCASFILSRKDVNKIAQGGIKQVVFKSLNQFYERFKEEIEELSSLPDWTRVASSPAEQSKVKDRCSRGSYFKLVLYSFSILNEVALKSWRPVSIDLLRMLKMVHEAAVLGTGKQKMNQESRTMFDFLIVRGLTVLLNTTFSEDKELIGESQNDHPEYISHLITEVINCKHGTTQRELLLREVRGPAFHKATRVRQTFNILHRADETQLEDLAHGYIEQNLRGLGFRFDETRRATSKGDDSAVRERTCRWITSPCKVSGIKGDCVMYVPTVNCMVKEDFTIGTCLEKHPVKEFAAVSTRHKQNMKMLQILSPKTDRVLKLLAYNYKPFPFYITEAIEEDDRLLSFLRLHRRQGYWLSTETVVKILQQVLDILIRLDNESLVTRDLTCYNLVVRENCKSGSTKPRCQVLKECVNFTIQLADLSLIHEYRNEEDICIVRDHGPVPARWTAPEALFQGRYSHKSAVWAFGCVMQEIATYGCEPYTSYQNMTTEEILKKMKLEPGSVKLFHWPFIQSELFSLIEKCTRWDPEERPSFAEVKEELSNIKATGSFGELPLEEALSKEGRYPTPSNSQITRKHVPEKGIPLSVQLLIDARKTSDLYLNTCVLSWHREPHTAIEPGELFTSDSADIEIKDDMTLVKEKLHEKFVNGELRLLESSKLPVKCWKDGEQGLVRLAQHDGQHVHEREYAASKILKSIVATGEFWSEDDNNYNEPSTDTTLLCLHVLTSLADAMCQLHSQSWLFRDFRVSNVLVNCNTGEAFLARIGRMRHLRGSEDNLLEEPFPDSWRRLAPEVLVAKTYSRASDVFMFGTMIWELFNTREITKINPKARDEDFEPCADIPKNEVINFIREGTPLPRHEFCPGWLYELILQCRHPNPTMRPTAEHVSCILRAHSAEGEAIQLSLIRCIQNLVHESAPDEDTAERPEVPAREIFSARVSSIKQLFKRRLTQKKISEKRVSFRRSRGTTKRKHKKGFNNPTFEYDNASESRYLTDPQEDLQLQKRYRYSEYPTLSELLDVDQTTPKTPVSDEDIDDDHYDRLNFMEVASSPSFGEAPQLNTVQEKRRGNEYSHIKQRLRSIPPSGAKRNLSNKPPDKGEKKRAHFGALEQNKTHETCTTTLLSPTAPQVSAAHPENREQTSTRALRCQTADEDKGCEMERHGPERSATPPCSGEASGRDQHGHYTHVKSIQNGSTQNGSTQNDPELYENQITFQNTAISGGSCTEKKSFYCPVQHREELPFATLQNNGTSYGTVDEELTYSHPATADSMEAESRHIYLELDDVYVDARSSREHRELTLRIQGEATHHDVMDQLSSSEEPRAQCTADQSFCSGASLGTQASSVISRDCSNECYCQPRSEQWETMQARQYNVTAVCMDKNPFKGKLICEHTANILKQNRRPRNENHESFVAEICGELDESPHATGIRCPPVLKTYKEVDVENGTIHTISQIELTEAETPRPCPYNAFTNNSDDQLEVCEFRETF